MNLDQAKELALNVMSEHGLDDWTFRWSSAKSFFGMCSYHTQVLSFSRPLTELNDETSFLDTVLHETAHALVGPGKGHGPEWKAMASALGARPERVADKETTVLAPKKYFAVHHCGRKYSRDRLPSSRRFCTPCWNASGKDREFSLLTWVDRQSNVEVGAVSLRAAQMIGR